MIDNPQYISALSDDLNNMHSFVSREKPEPIDWEKIEKEISWSDETSVTVLRSSLFFYAEQKTTLGDLRKKFTEKAIITLEKDGYIKLNTW